MTIFGERGESMSMQYLVKGGKIRHEMSSGGMQMAVVFDACVTTELGALFGAPTGFMKMPTMGRPPA